jgi:hypothetical protein
MVLLGFMFVAFLYQTSYFMVQHVAKICESEPNQVGNELVGRIFSLCMEPSPSDTKAFRDVPTRYSPPRSPSPS